MNPKERRLAISLQTIQGWERMGRPGGRAADNLRMIREELRILASIEDPRARLLERRYSDIATRIRLALD